MRYSIEPRDRIYVKGHGFLSFAKNMGKNLSNKYSKKMFDTAKKFETDAIKTMGDLVGNNTADKIINVSKEANKGLSNNDETEDVELTTHKKRYISPEKRQQIIDELKLIPKIKVI